MTQGTKVAFRHRVHGDCLAGRECVHWPLAPVAACTAVRGALERASWLPVKLLVVLALASCFAFPGEFLLQASKRNQKTRPGIRPQPLLGWGALAASLLPAARRHGPSWTEAALAASCHSSPSATIPPGLLTGRVCRPTTWRASLTSCMPGTRSVGRITASGYSLYGSGLRYVEVWHARGHPPS